VAHVSVCHLGGGRTQPRLPVLHRHPLGAGTAELKAANDRILGASKLVTQENGLELWDTPKGQFWIPKGNRYVLPSTCGNGIAHLWNAPHFVREGDIVLDCGASDGDFSREALRAGAKLVVSIEVSPAAVACLRRNLAQPIAEHRSIVYPKACGTQRGRCG